jgi:hypothetical protein
MSSIALGCLAFFVSVLCSFTYAAANDHRSAKHTEVVAQFCMPADDYPDTDRLYC